MPSGDSGISLPLLGAKSWERECSSVSRNSGVPDTIKTVNSNRTLHETIFPQCGLLTRSQLFSCRQLLISGKKKLPFGSFSCKHLKTHHFMRFTSSTYTVCLDLKRAKTIAKPTAASAAATAMTKNTNICPAESPR